MRVPLPRVRTHHASRRARGNRAEQRTGAPLTKAAHLAWSALVIGAVAGLVGLELTASCPSGGPLAFGDCDRVRPFAIAVAAFAALLYVAALTGVRWWTRGLVRRGVADPRAARDWYLIVAGVGLPIAPMLAFTLLSALR